MAAGVRGAGRDLPGGARAARLAPVERDERVERPPDEREGLRAVFRDRSARRWTLAELVAYSAWTAELTYIGAFYIQTYDISETTVGFLLAVGSVAFAISTLSTASLTERFERRRLIVCAALGMGVMLAVIMNVTPAVVFTLCLFFVMALMAGVRSTGSSSLGLDQLPSQPGSMMAARTASAQLGYMFGAIVGGAVLAVSGFGTLGFVLLAGMALSALLVARRQRPDGLDPKRAAAALAIRARRNPDDLVRPGRVGQPLLVRERAARSLGRAIRPRAPSRRSA